MHRWAFDSGDARDSVGSAAGSVQGARAHVRMHAAHSGALALPSGDDFALTLPLDAALRPAAGFVLLSCFRFDAAPAELEFESGSAASAERAVLTLMQSPRAAASFLELSVMQRAGALGSANRSASVYVARVRDEGGATFSAPLGDADAGAQFSCWSLAVRGAETTLAIDGVPVLLHTNAFVGSFDAGLASLLLGRARWSQALAAPERALGLEIDVVELYDHDVAQDLLVQHIAAIRCTNGLRDALIDRDGGRSGFFEDGVDCQLKRDGASVTQPCVLCAARCANGERDGDEDDVDCGGVSCAACVQPRLARSVRVRQLLASSGVRRLNATSMVVAAHGGLRLVSSAVGMLQCNKCPPIVGARFFQYQFATPTAVQSTVVACDSKKAKSHDGCFGRALESDPALPWFVVDLQEPVALRELHWWQHWRSPGCVARADVEVAGADFRFRVAASVEFDTGVAMQRIQLDASVAGSAVRFVRVVVRATVGDDGEQRQSYAFRRILFYRLATAADELRLTGSGTGVGIADDRLPTSAHAGVIDPGEMLALTFRVAVLLRSVTLHAPEARGAGRVLARLQCFEAQSRRDVVVDLGAGETAVSGHMPRGVSNCVLAAARDAAFQVSEVKFD